MEVLQLQRGHGEDLNDCTMPEGFVAPTPQGRVGPFPRQTLGFERQSAEVDKDRKSADASFDILIKQRWIQHLSDLPESVAITKRWNGYWHRWFEDVGLNTEDGVSVLTSRRSVWRFLRTSFATRTTASTGWQRSNRAIAATSLSYEARRCLVWDLLIIEDDRRVESALQDLYT